MFIDKKILTKTNKLMKKRLSYWLRQSTIEDKKALIKLVDINSYAACVHILNEEYEISENLKKAIDVTMELLTIQTFIEVPSIEDLSEDGKASYYGALLLIGKNITLYQFISNEDNFQSKLKEEK